MEFGQDLNTEILVAGAGTKMQSPSPSKNTPGFGWRAKYGYVGLAATKDGGQLLRDCMNEKGLSIGALWLPGYTQYSSDVSNDAQALDVALLANWVLGSFATVAEVVAGLTGVEIWGSSSMVINAPLHFSIHDATGTSVVLEFLKDNTQGLVQPNLVGVLTNAPPFA
jgi:choloylglycine hydrolase